LCTRSSELHYRSSEAFHSQQMVVSSLPHPSGEDPSVNVKFDSYSRQDPSSEFESVKTKLVL
jgi:hypothetical protein